MHARYIDVDYDTVPDAEKAATLGNDPLGGIATVSALRRYRQALRGVLRLRYADGTIDGPTIYGLIADIEDIERDLRDWPA